MEKRTKFKFLGALGLFAGALLLSGCVSNFCTPIEQARIAYPYEQGVTVYVDGQVNVPEEYQAVAFQPYGAEGNTDLYAYIPVDAEGSYKAEKASFLNGTIIANAKKSNISIPSYDFFKGMDQKLLDAVITAANADKTTVTAAEINPYSKPDATGKEKDVTVNENSLLRKYGYLKFVTVNATTNKIDFNFGNWNKWSDELATEISGGISAVPNSDFTLIYKNAINNSVANVRTCITTKTGDYGHYGPANDWPVQMDSVSWGDAWSKGFFEGLIVYPVSCLMDGLSFAFDPMLSGIGQIWALVITTIIVRAVVILLTFKSTMDQQKMQALQPQIAKIQAKYPNSNTNNAERQKLSQETMILYKRNKINMFSSFITIIVQFPVFISVWGALQGSAVLSSGEVLNLRLSDTISSVLTNFSGAWYTNATGWWTAGILFILMSVIQFVAMKLPQWITKARTKKIAKTTANPAADKNNSTMKTVSWVMLIFTIVMGFMLPAAMGVYWAIGGLIAMAQTGITQFFMAKRNKK